jgi:hypothetical protein
MRAAGGQAGRRWCCGGIACRQGGFSPRCRPVLLRNPWLRVCGCVCRWFLGLLKSRVERSNKRDAGELAPAFTCRLSEDKDTDLRFASKSPIHLSTCLSKQSCGRNRHRDHHRSSDIGYLQSIKIHTCNPERPKGQSTTDSTILLCRYCEAYHSHRTIFTDIDRSCPHIFYSFVTSNEKTCHPVTFDRSRCFRICPHGVGNFRFANLTLVHIVWSSGAKPKDKVEYTSWSLELSIVYALPGSLDSRC